MRHESKQPLRERTTAAMFKLMGSKAYQDQSDDDLDAPAAAPVSFGKEERYMVTGVLSLAERSIRTIMTTHSEMAWIDINDSSDEIHALLQREPHSLFPLCDGNLDEVIGVVKARDLLFALNERQSLSELAKQNDPIIGPQTINVLRLLAELRKAKGSLILVSDEFGVIQGLVTTHDLLEAIPSIRPMTQPPAVDYRWPTGHLSRPHRLRPAVLLRIRSNDTYDCLTVAIISLSSPPLFRKESP